METQTNIEKSVEKNDDNIVITTVTTEVTSRSEESIRNEILVVKSQLDNLKNLVNDYKKKLSELEELLK